MVNHTKTDIDSFIAKLRLQPGDLNGPSRNEMLRERQQAADLIEILVAAHAAHDDLVQAMAIIAPALQMALEMGSVDLPANGVADLKRGMALFYQWRADAATSLGSNAPDGSRTEGQAFRSSMSL